MPWLSHLLESKKKKEKWRRSNGWGGGNRECVRLLRYIVCICKNLISCCCTIYLLHCFWCWDNQKWPDKVKEDCSMIFCTTSKTANINGWWIDAQVAFHYSNKPLLSACLWCISTLCNLHFCCVFLIIAHHIIWEEWASSTGSGSLTLSFFLLLQCLDKVWCERLQNGEWKPPWLSTITHWLALSSCERLRYIDEDVSCTLWTFWNFSVVTREMQHVHAAFTWCFLWTFTNGRVEFSFFLEVAAVLACSQTIIGFLGLFLQIIYKDLC